MPKIALKAGAEIDLLSKDELDDSLGRYFTAREMARLRGKKHMRLPEVLTGTAASNKLSLGEANGQIVGPRSGYCWVAKRLVVSGLTSGAGADVVNLYRSSTGGLALWQFNGNNFGYTFGKLEITLYPGETFALASVGTFNSTSTITLSGEVIEVPAERLGELA